MARTQCASISMPGTHAELRVSPMSNQPGKNDEQDTFLLLPQYFACYGFLALIVVIMTWLMLQLRAVIVEIGLALNFSRWSMTVLDQFGFIVLGIVWLIAFLAIEHYLRQGVPSKKVLPRAGKIIMWEFFLVFFVFAAQQILA